HGSPTLARLFLFSRPAPPLLYTLSLHDALPIYSPPAAVWWQRKQSKRRRFLSNPIRRPHWMAIWANGKASHRLSCSIAPNNRSRSEEHTSELQSRENLVCRLLLEKKKQYDAGSI